MLKHENAEEKSEKFIYSVEINQEEGAARTPGDIGALAKLDESSYGFPLYQADDRTYEHSLPHHILINICRRLTRR